MNKQETKARHASRGLKICNCISCRPNVLRRWAPKGSSLPVVKGYEDKKGE